MALSLVAEVQQRIGAIPWRVAGVDGVDGAVSRSLNKYRYKYKYTGVGGAVLLLVE